MKYISLGYFDKNKWEAMSESEQQAFMDECFAYDDLLRKNALIVGGEALQSARNASTPRWKNSKVSITDGPYAETKEQCARVQGVRSRGSEPCDPADVEASGRKERFDRDSPGRDFLKTKKLDY